MIIRFEPQEMPAFFETHPIIIRIGDVNKTLSHQGIIDPNPHDPQMLVTAWVAAGRSSKYPEDRNNQSNTPRYTLNLNTRLCPPKEQPWLQGMGLRISLLPRQWLGHGRDLGYMSHNSGIVDATGSPLLSLKDAFDKMSAIEKLLLDHAPTGRPVIKATDKHYSDAKKIAENLGLI